MGVDTMGVELAEFVYKWISGERGGGGGHPEMNGNRNASDFTGTDRRVNLIWIIKAGGRQWRLETMGNVFLLANSAADEKKKKEKKKKKKMKEGEEREKEIQKETEEEWLAFSCRNIEWKTDVDKVHKEEELGQGKRRNETAIRSLGFATSVVVVIHLFWRAVHLTRPRWCWR